MPYRQGYQQVLFAQGNDVARILALGNLPADQTSPQLPQLEAVQIAHELVHQLRGSGRRRADAVGLQGRQNLRPIVMVHANPGGEGAAVRRFAPQTDYAVCA